MSSEGSGTRARITVEVKVWGLAALLTAGLTYGWFLALGLFSSIWGGVQCIVPEVYGQGCVPRLRTLGGLMVWSWLVSGLAGYWVFLQLDALGFPRITRLIRERIARSARRRRHLFLLLDTPVTPSSEGPLRDATPLPSPGQDLRVTVSHARDED